LDGEVEPLTAEQRLVLQAVYDQFRAHGTWPTFITIDRPLRRTHGRDARSVIQSLPDSLIVKPRPAPSFAADDELRLRLPGIQACQGSSDDTERFIRLLRWLAVTEMDFEPAPGSTETMPQVTSEEAREHLGIDTDDPVALQRLYAMLQLDHWGLGGSGSGPDGWHVLLGPEIWRFRDVQTIEDCIKARLQWRLEAEAAVPRMHNPAPAPEYYHVRLSTKSIRSHDEVRLDLSADELELRFLAPYREGRAIVINGKAIPMDDLAALRISRTDQSSEQLRPVIKAERRASNVFAIGISDNWYIAAKGDNMTDQLITEPPGSAAARSLVSKPLTETGSTQNTIDGTSQGQFVQARDIHGNVYYNSPPLLPQPAPQPSVPSYIDQQIINAIRAKEGKTSFNVAKLLRLIEELNDNYAKRNIYATHVSLRAILDHIPPILGSGDFKAVAINYPWSRTDKGYMKKLLEFKLQADDALHRQISSQADLLNFEHLPSNLYVNHLLQECTVKL
jgi:hypothetical protein